MESLRNDYYNKKFSHIYVEKAVSSHPRAQKILQRFPDAHIVEINHYKDVFCRKGQQVELQHRAQALILAQKTGNLLYEGAAVCQSFGNEHFYYTSCVMNCVYDCEYCYLKGMYPSAHMVVFVNLEDVFRELEKLLQKHGVYLCVSYDTDLPALEELTGFVQEWEVFAAAHEGLRMEIRTKCGRQDLWDSLSPNPRVIYAFTLSPEYVAREYEHGTSTLDMRVGSAKKAIEKGFSVRLCFDPMLYCPNWKREYQEMLVRVFGQIKPEELVDVSIGSFRISQDYLKSMRKSAPLSPVVQFPYENRQGVYQYPEALKREMEDFLQGELEKHLPGEKIFHWEE
ncbi:MAG: radical SAM protein [Lachnospiraceae bacterium]|nr:radical SAM protein [Lachnospiraceae bacterium]